MSAKVRPYDDQDARRDAAVEMLLKHVAKQRGQETAEAYRVDIEWMDEAVIAFADEWAEAKERAS